MHYDVGTARCLAAWHRDHRALAGGDAAVVAHRQGLIPPEQGQRQEEPNKSEHRAADAAAWRGLPSARAAAPAEAAQPHEGGCWLANKTHQHRFIINVAHRVRKISSSCRPECPGIEACSAPLQRRTGVHDGVKTPLVGSVPGGHTEPHGRTASQELACAAGLKRPSASSCAAGRIFLSARLVSKCRDARKSGRYR